MGSSSSCSSWCPEPGAQESDPVDLPIALGEIRLLLDSERAVGPPPGEPVGDVLTIADGGGIDALHGVDLAVAPPGPQDLDSGVVVGGLPRACRRQRTKVDVGVQKVAELTEIVACDRVGERPADRVGAGPGRGGASHGSEPTPGPDSWHRENSR